MRSSKEASNGNMCSDAQVVILVQRGKELHIGLVPRRITWISRSAKADRKREYLITNLGEICSVVGNRNMYTVSMRDLPVPEL